MACPSTVLHSQRLPALKSIIPSYCEETCRLLLETLNAHQAATRRIINPKDDTENLERLATSHYILKLIEDAESTFPLSSSYGLMLEERVKRIQDILNMWECPQPERPNVTASQALIQLQRSESLSADYKNWSPDEPIDEAPLHVLFFASRAFGGLSCKLPPNINHKDPCLSLLVLLYDRHDQLLNNTLKNHDKQDTKDLFLTYEFFVQ